MDSEAKTMDEEAQGQEALEHTQWLAKSRCSR
jgi:hypothetical protein